jgi:acetyl-CoA carboxylase biotin carboxyl carrier protein
MNRPGRLHAPSVDALADPPAELDGRPTIALRAPRPGIFIPAIGAGDLVAPGGVIGALVVLGQSFAVIAHQVSGFAIQGALSGRRAVGYGDLLVTLDLSLARDAGTGAAADPAAAPGAAATGLVFRAPTSGRFYGRSSPDKPAFVSPGTQLSQGATICLLEVMKTFSRVTYGGPGLPDTARVVRVLIADGADVNAGQPLLELE